MQLYFDQAVAGDLESLVNMLADDFVGTTREDPTIPLNPCYLDAFEAISRDPNNELIVVNNGSAIVGIMQLTFIPYLTHTGSWRCLIEGVRIRKNYRDQGLGTHFSEWAIDCAKEKGCQILQLTSDKQRTDAIRFYESLGFTASHEGFKMKLI